MAWIGLIYVKTLTGGDQNDEVFWFHEELKGTITKNKSGGRAF